MRSGRRTFAFSLFVGTLLIFSIWSGGGCSPSDKARPGTQARWEHQLGWHKPVGAAPDAGKSTGRDRKVADAPPRCLKDRVADPQFLRQEVARLERARGGTAVVGDWQNKDLATFPAPQGGYLSANRDWIGTTGFDFSSCNDLPCILNKVYGPDASNQGWKIYYFYLAMGYPVSCIDYVPQTSSRWREVSNQVTFTAPFAAHLFTDTELLSFWKLSYLLPDAYHFMGSQRFHRIPDGNQVPDSNWGPNTCADSWGNKDHGFIRAKRCIEEDNFANHIIYDGDDASIGDNGIRGSFYMTITHEMTHTWDRTQSTGADAAGRLLRFADTDAWKNLSGWHMETVVSPPAADGTGGGVSSSRWQPTTDGDGFVRAYARNDPYEDLAETSAWVRLRPTLVTQRSPRKATFLSRNIFGGRTYDAAGLTSYYTDSTVSALTSTATSTTSQLSDLVNNCLAQTAAAPGTTTGTTTGAAIAGSVHLTLDHPLPEAVVGCLETDLGNRISALLDGLRGTEWEACDHLNSQETRVRTDIFSRVSAEVSRLVSQNIDRAPAIRAAQQLRTALALQVDPREAYVHCYRVSQPENCYQQALSDAFDHVAQSSDLATQTFASELGEDLSIEKTSFLAQNTFAQSQTKSTLFYRQVFAGIEPRVTAIAERRWQTCISSPASPTPVSGGTGGQTPLVLPFSGGIRFVAAEILNCINSNYDSDLRTVRDAFISHLGLSISDPDLQALIQSLLLPAYLDALNTKQDQAVVAEDADRNRRKAGVVDVLKAQLVRDLGWLEGALTADAAVAPCALAAATAFNDYFSHVSPAEQLPSHFAAIDDIRTSWSRDACAQVVASPVVAQVLTQRAQRAWLAATTALETAVATRARDTATDCIARNPSGALRPTLLVRNHRHQCLTSAQTWAIIETQALVDWSQSSEGRSFAVSRRTDATTYLTAHRRALQASAITAMDAR